MRVLACEVDHQRDADSKDRLPSESLQPRPSIPVLDRKPIAERQRATFRANYLHDFNWLELTRNPGGIIPSQRYCLDVGLGSPL